MKPFDPTVEQAPTKTAGIPAQVFDPTMEKSIADAAEQQYGRPFDKKTDLTFVGDALRGNAEFDFPDLGEAQVPFKSVVGLLASSDDQQKLDILKKLGADISEDKNGNIIVGMPGQGTYYLNKPGLSVRDLTGPVAQGAAYLASAQLASPVASTAARGVLTGLTSAGTSVGLDKVAQLAGSEQPVNLARAGLAGIGGTAAEWLSPAIGHVVRAVRGNGGRMLSVDEARTLLVNTVGGRPEDFTDDLVNYVRKNALDAISPQTAARVGVGATLPHPVELTAGQATGKKSQQLFEDGMASGAYGQTPENIMSDFLRTQQGDLRANIPAIQSQLAGGNPQVNLIREGGQLAHGKITQQAANARSAINAAYETAKSKVASVGPQEADELITGMQGVAAKWDIDPPPSLIGYINKLTKLTRGGSNIKKLHEVRQQLTQVIQNSTNGKEKLVLADLKKTLDDTLDGWATNGKLLGDKGATEAWKNAITLRREYGGVYESDNILQKITNKNANKRLSDLYTGDELFGVSGGINFGKRGLYDDLVAVRNALGKKSPEWNALREEAWLRMARKMEGGMQGGERMVSGANIFKFLDNNLKGGNRQIMEVLFDPHELRVMEQLAKFASTATSTARNASNTTNAAANLMQRLFSFPFFREKALLWASAIPVVGKGVQVGKGQIGARMATTGTLPMRNPIRGGVLGGMGGLASSRLVQQEGQSQ